MGLRNFRAIDFAQMGEGAEPKLGDNPLPLSRVPKAEKAEPKRAARAPKAQPEPEPVPEPEPTPEPEPEAEPEAEERHGNPGDLILP